VPVPCSCGLRAPSTYTRSSPSKYWRVLPAATCPCIAPEAAGTGASPQALGALLGRTRARTLVALRDTGTTGELARRLGVSPASVSQHVHALAATNLVRSHRAGNQVLHMLTPLGTALLTGVCPPERP
jgi:DNA-binding transcriptional ArsR family regulator